MHFAFATHFHFEPLGDRIYALRADTVETTGDLVGAFAELTTGVEVGHHQLKGRDLILRVYVDRDAATVVLNGARAVVVDADSDLRAMAGEGFIDRVIDDFENTVVEAAFVGVADIHIGAFTDTFETFELLDFGRVIDVLSGVFWRHLSVQIFRLFLF
jgi:hypothetical protein